MRDKVLKTRKGYSYLPGKDAPRVNLKLPEHLYQDITAWANKNARTRNEEIIARLIATLNLNEEFMRHDRLMRLIYNKKLAFKPDK
jgi:hypothetical protein